MKIVDQYMGFYTPLVLVIGALVWAFTHDLNRVIAVFVVSCPCAFILATPTAMVAALSAAARLGILIKNVADIEAAAKINAFVFDKTGTLTTGQLAVSRLAPIGETKPAELLRSPRPPKNTATIRPPRRSRNSRAKPACRWPSRRILPKPPVAA
jgi:Cd2+/Zn2+-exporting ATPase